MDGAFAELDPSTLAEPKVEKETETCLLSKLVSMFRSAKGAVKKTNRHTDDMRVKRSANDPRTIEAAAQAHQFARRPL